MTAPATSEVKLRQAMQRLLTGTAQRTDGRLVKENLYREAGVSRATMNRHPDILRDWDAHVDSPTPRDRAREALEANLAEQRNTVRELRAKITELEGQLTLAATVIAELTTDNELLREGARSGVVPLGRRNTKR